LSRFKDNEVINPNLISGATRWAVAGALLLALAVGLYLGQSLFIPLVIALLLAAMLWPVANGLNCGYTTRGFGWKNGFPWVERRGTLTLSISWGTACVAVVLLLVALTFIVPLCLVLAIPNMLQGFPTDEDQQQRNYERFREKIAAISQPLADENFPKNAEDSRVFKTIKASFDPNKPIILELLQKAVSYLVSWFWQYILIMFVLFFLLLEGRMLSRRVVEIFGPSPQTQAKAVLALQDMAKQVRTYLVWRTIVNFGLAIILGCFYKWVIGLSQPWTWALLTAILCYIPYLGPIAAGIFPILDAFLTCDTPWMAVVVFVFYLCIITLEGYLIVPVVMGRPMQLNATTVLLACLFWDLVWGTPGLFLAMPLLAALKTVCIHVPGWQAWANLMSTENHETKLERAAEGDGMFDDTQVLSPDEAAALGEARRTVLERK
jgi:predicted PurR-regulated permease PerM